MSRPHRLLVAAAVLLSSLAGARTIENFDALADARKQPFAVAAQRLSRPLAKVATVAHVEERLGVPTFVWSAHDGKSGQAAWVEGDVVDLEPSQAARRYLLELSELYGLSANDVSNARVREVHDLGQGAIIVRFTQRMEGVEVFRSELNVVMNQKRQLIAVSGYLTPLSASSKLVSEGFRLSPANAIAAAFVDLTAEHIDGGDLVTTEELSGGYEYFRMTDAAASRVSSPMLIDTRIKPVLFWLPGELVPGFYLELKVGSPEETTSDYVSYVVSAKDGSILFRNNLTRHAANTYKVWANATDFVPYDSPQGTAVTPHATGTWGGSSAQAITTYDPQLSVTLDHAGISTNDPWLTNTETTTFGNNVRAYADISSPDGYGSGDVVADVTSANAFERTYDVTAEPSLSVDQRKASVTQLFYNVNFFHDFYYDVGFDEAAGNAQSNNFGRGGFGNDPLLAEAQDYSGTDNANMQIPADGASPVMQMYRFLTQATTALRVTAPSNMVSTLNTGYSQVGASTYDLQNVQLARANDGTAPTDDACTALPSSSLAGKVALIVRGTCYPSQKAANAAAAGAVAVIIYNDRTGNPQTLYGSGSISIPVVSITQTAGQSLVNALNQGATVTVTLQRIATGVTRDGTLDNGVVAHEWGHYISSRLIGNGNGLNNLQGGGLGEGFGDFHSMLMVVRPEDAQLTTPAWRGVYPMASYAMGASSGAAAYYFGIRRVPYSTRMDRDPLTYKHIGDGVALPNTAPFNGDLSGSYNSEVHATGEVWCTMLWEAYAALLSDPRHTFAQAQHRMKMYLVGGYKATPTSPTFLEARDAILAVATANDQADYESIMGAFAKRGMGNGATAPDRHSQDNTPLVEDFTVGGNLAFIDATLDDDVTSCDRDGHLDNTETGTLTVRIKNTGTKALSATTGSATSTNSGITFPDGATLTFPSTQPLQVVSVSVRVALSGMTGPGLLPFAITFTDPGLADLRNIPASYALKGNFDEVDNASLTDDVEAVGTPWTRAFDTSQSWLGNMNPFVRVPAENGGTLWHAPNADAPEGQYLISPKLNVSSESSFVITYRNRWAFEADNTNAYDGAVLELRVDGTTQWVDVGNKANPGYNTRLYNGRQTSNWFIPSANPLRDRNAWGRQSNGYPAFITTTVDLGSAYAGKTVQVRFRVGSDDAEGWEGWDIDDIHVSGVTHLPFPTVVDQPQVCNDKRPLVTVTPLTVTLEERKTVTLTATATDPESKPLNYLWTQLSGTKGTFSNGDALTTSFTVPTVNADEQIVLSFRANDGAVSSVPAKVEITVKNVNHAPVSKVVTPFDGPQGTVVELDGSGTTDEDGDTLFFLWKQVAGTRVTLSSLDDPKVTFTVPNDAPVGEQLIFSLDAADATTVNAQPALAIVTVRPAPIVEEAALPEEPPAGCGCSSGAELAPLLGLLVLLRRRRE